MEKLQPLKELRGAKQLLAWQQMADRRDTDALFASLMVDHYDPLTTAIRRNYTARSGHHRSQSHCLDRCQSCRCRRRARAQFDPAA